MKVVYRSLQTATPDPATFTQQQSAAGAAGAQDRAWNYIETFYREQDAEGTGYVTNSFLTGLARQTPGLDLTRWRRDMTASRITAAVAADGRRAAAAGYDVTPTLVVSGPRGTAAPMTGVVGVAQIERAVAGVR